MALADFHAASWADAYRGILTDAYLDHGVRSDRRAVWAKRFETPEPGLVLSVGEDDAGIVALASIVPGADPAHGALIDNLHVRPDAKGRGLGKRILGHALSQLTGADLERPIWLTVYRDNVGARRAYDALGGAPSEPFTLTAPDGETRWIVRYSWASAQALRNRAAR